MVVGPRRVAFSLEDSVDDAVTVAALIWAVPVISLSSLPQFTTSTFNTYFPSDSFVNEGVFTVRQAGAAVGGGVGVATEGVVPPQPISKAAKRTILIVSMSKRDIREVDIVASFFG
jgi:hypothetical protein